MKHVRGSEVSSFLRCRKQWKYSWIDMLEPKRQDNKLFFGNLAHKFLEIYYKNFNQDHIPPAEMAMIAMEYLFQHSDTSGMPQTEIDELWDLATGVMKNYVQQWEAHDAGITVLATELRFAIPLDDETVYEGTIDMVYLDRDGLLRFKDYKNVSSIERYSDMAEMDRQISRYWWALEQLSRGNGHVWMDEQWMDINRVDWSRPGYPHSKLPEPSGFVYDLILKDVPVVPSLLKPTAKVPVALSKAKNQKTTYKVYIQALLDNGLKVPVLDDDGNPIEGRSNAPEEYNEILDHLLAQETEFGNRFFRRIPVVRNESECQAAMHEFLAVVRDMDSVSIVMRLRNDPGTDFEVPDPTYRNINADCSWCNYRALCVAELDGSHADMIKNLTYKQKEIKDHAEIRAN